MGTFLWLMLLFPGACDLSSFVPRQFHVVKEEKTWTEAQQYCREKYTDLATVDDMAEMEILKGIIQEEGVAQAWIGMNYSSSPKWQWSLADRDFYGENEAEYRNWAPGHPLAAGGYCMYVWYDGQWYVYDCGHTLYFVCYNGRNSVHPYVLIKVPTTWADAQRHCREHYTDLASVRNQTENDQIGALIAGYYVYIGLFRNPWQWSDGSNSSFRNWASGHPGGEDLCAEVLSTGLWRGGGCSEHKHFICYGASKEKVKQIVRVQLPVASGVNMEDPDVQEAFLQKMRQRLGLPPDAKVSWMKQADGKVFHKEKKEVKKKQKRSEL